MGTGEDANGNRPKWPEIYDLFSEQREYFDKRFDELRNDVQAVKEKIAAQTPLPDAIEKLDGRITRLESAKVNWRTIGLSLGAVIVVFGLNNVLEIIQNLPWK